MKLRGAATLALLTAVVLGLHPAEATQHLKPKGIQPPASGGSGPPASLTITPASVTGGTPATGAISLPGPALAGGAAVSLSTSVNFQGLDCAPLLPPVRSPDCYHRASRSRQGAPAQAPLDTSSFLSPTALYIVIKASYGGQTGQASLGVAATPFIGSLALNSSSAAGRTSVTGTLSLLYRAPIKFYVRLQGNNPAVAPAVIAVEKDQDRVNFVVATGYPGSTPVDVTITVSIPSWPETPRLPRSGSRRHDGGLASEITLRGT